MNISPLIAIVPVVLAVALIIILVRRNITERRPGEPIDIAGAVPAFVVLMVAVIIIGGMAYSVTDLEDYDEGTGTLTIKASIQESGSYPWDSYGSSVKSLVISDGVESVPDGAFDSLTSLQYLRIVGDTEMTSSAFAVELVDYADQTISDPAVGQYVGTGDGELFLFDDGIFTYSSGGSQVTGLTSAAASAVNLVVPSTHNGINITTIGSGAFNANAVIETLLVLPDSHLVGIYSSAFKDCTSLAKLALPDNMTSIGTSAFSGCSSLTELALPSGSYTLGGSSFRNCTGLVSVSFSSGITSISSYAFASASAIQSVTFASGFSATLDAQWAGAWTFYASDGTTTIDKTDASALAGKTFQGTAAALVEVAPGQLALTPDQIQQVHLHDQELQDLQNQPISIDPLPFQPSLQTQEQELTA